MTLLDRAVTVMVGDRAVRVVTPEDLLLMKIISDRPRDLADAEGLARRRRGTLDRAYLEPRIREFAETLERPEMLARLERMDSLSLPRSANPLARGWSTGAAALAAAALLVGGPHVNARTLRTRAV